MKIALAQINTVVGDFSANVKKMIDVAGGAKSAGCQLVIFPELSLSGYPPQDLLERRSFLDDQDSALKDLVDGVNGIGLLCGLFTRHTGEAGKTLHNSAVLIEDGRVQAAHKRLLPTYDVFDESRYFESAQDSRVLEFRGLRLGITICEDILNEPGLGSNIMSCRYEVKGENHSLYDANPLADLFENEAPVDLLINIAASPFHVSKPAARLDYFSKLSAKYQKPLLYVNQVGGQDSLVFDGISMVFGSDGNLVAKGASFCEDLLIIESASWQMIEPKTGVDFEEKKSVAPQEKWLPGAGATDHDAREVFSALVLGTRDYVRKCGFQQVVIGLSGGIDSALTAAVAVCALGSENVFGVTLPSPYSSTGSVEDSKALADNLNIEIEVVPIGDIFKAYLHTLSPFFADTSPDVTEQNIQARIRGNLLMAMANKFGRLLLSTGNKSEMAVGYCTLYGDMSGGLAVISDVPKVMVYRICRYLNEMEEIIPWNTINKPPSAELAPDQKDQDDLPPYDVLDPILEAHLEYNMGVKEIVAQGYDVDLVKDVVRRVRVNEHKRKQAPLGLKVTNKAFGYGRRYPITQGYVESAV